MTELTGVIYVFVHTAPKIVCESVQQTPTDRAKQQRTDSRCHWSMNPHKWFLTVFIHHEKALFPKAAQSCSCLPCLLVAQSAFSTTCELFLCAELQVLISFLSCSPISHPDVQLFSKRWHRQFLLALLSPPSSLSACDVPASSQTFTFSLKTRQENTPCLWPTIKLSAVGLISRRLNNDSNYLGSEEKSNWEANKKKHFFFISWHRIKHLFLVSWTLNSKHVWLLLRAEIGVRPREV